MESWVTNLADLVGMRMWTDHGEFTNYATCLVDDQDAWWKYVIEDLLIYKKTNKFRLGNLTEIVFRLGDFRINIYSSESGIMDCKWNVISPQKSELETMAEAIIQTLLIRFREHKELNNKRISDWIVDQLKKRNMRYEYPSFL